MRVLIVEDHGESRKALIALLEQWGFEVVAAAADYQSAVEFIATKQFDVLLSDIGLPDGTGFAVMEQARKHHPNAIGVAISAFGSPVEIELGQRVGFHHHMRKPVDVQQLHAILDRAAA